MVPAACYCASAAAGAAQTVQDAVAASGDGAHSCFHHDGAMDEGASLVRRQTELVHRQTGLVHRAWPENNELRSLGKAARQVL